MRRKNIVEIMAILQHLRAGASNSQIKQELKVSRHTARAYRQWAGERRLLAGPLPPIEELEQLRTETFGQTLPPQNVSSVEPYRAFVLNLFDQGVEVAAIYQRLAGQGFSGSYAAVDRFVRRGRPKQPPAGAAASLLGRQAPGKLNTLLNPGFGRRSWGIGGRSS